MQFRVHFEDPNGVKCIKSVNTVDAANASKFIRREYAEPIVIHKVKIDREVHNIKRGKAHG